MRSRPLPVEIGLIQAWSAKSATGDVGHLRFGRLAHEKGLLPDTARLLVDGVETHALRELTDNEQWQMFCVRFQK